MKSSRYSHVQTIVTRALRQTTPSSPLVDAIRAIAQRVTREARDASDQSYDLVDRVVALLARALPEGYAARGMSDTRIPLRTLHV